MISAAPDLFAWTGMLASASISTPTVVRLVRQHCSVGVNRLTSSASQPMSVWAVRAHYGALRPLYFQVPGNAISMVATLLLFGDAGPDGQDRPRPCYWRECYWRAAPDCFYSATSRRLALGGSHFSSRHLCVSRN